MLLLMTMDRRLTTDHLQCAIFIKPLPHGSDTDGYFRMPHCTFSLIPQDIPEYVIVARIL